VPDAGPCVCVTGAAVVKKVLTKYDVAYCVLLPIGIYWEWVWSDSAAVNKKSGILNDHPAEPRVPPINPVIEGAPPWLWVEWAAVVK
jgi:hypothetical protein